MSQQTFTAPAHRVAIVTIIVAANMLGLAATDLYLPTIPALPNLFETNIQRIQFTLASFSAGFAISQILIGAMGDLYDRRWILIGSLLIFVPASMWCAMATTVESLIAARFVQGLSASASAALTVPMLLPLFSERQSVRAISVIGGIDAIIPAIAPLLGAWIFTQFGVGAVFWAVVFVGLPILAAALFYIPTDRAETHHTRLWPVIAGYRTLLTHRPFMGYALSHGFALGGLLVVVLSAPYLIVDHLGGETEHFVYCQIVWVGLFLLTGNSTGLLSKWLSPDQLIGMGTRIQMASAALLLLYVLLTSQINLPLLWQGLLLPMALFCGGMGVRAGAGFSQAVRAVAGFETRASALMIFFSMGIVALSVALAALYLDQGLITVALAQVALMLASWGMLRFIRPFPPA